MEYEKYFFLMKHKASKIQKYFFLAFSSKFQKINVVDYLVCCINLSGKNDLL